MITLKEARGQKAKEAGKKHEFKVEKLAKCLNEVFGRPVEFDIVPHENGDEATMVFKNTDQLRELVFPFEYSAEEEVLFIKHGEGAMNRFHSIKTISYDVLAQILCMYDIDTDK